MTSPNAHEAELLDALRALDPSNPRDELAIASLLAAVSADEALTRAALEFLAYPQAELELHLEGRSVTDHATRADRFGRLVTRLSGAVNEVAKSMQGVKRHTPGLQVLAPARGSVKVIVRAPTPQGNELTSSFEGADDTTVDSRALTFVTALLRMAEEDAGPSGESPIVAAAERVSPRARQRIRSIASTVIDANWEVAGTLRQRGVELEHIRLNARAALRLYGELNRSVTETTVEAQVGTIDGQRHSLNAMWFIPVGGRPFEVAVNDAELMQRVTELSIDPELRVRCQFKVLLSIPEGSLEATSRSRELIAITPMPPDIPLPGVSGPVALDPWAKPRELPPGHEDPF